MSASIAPRESASLSVNLFGVLLFSERNARIERLKIRALEITDDEIVQAELDSDAPRELRLRDELRSARAEIARLEGGARDDVGALRAKGAV